jgi:hypothetical protein
MKGGRPFIKISVRLPENLRFVPAGEVGQTLFARLLSKAVLAAGQSGVDHGGFLPQRIVSRVVTDDDREYALARLVSERLIYFVDRSEHRQRPDNDRLVVILDELDAIADGGGLWLPSWEKWYGSSLKKRSAAAERTRRYRARQRGEDVPLRTRQATTRDGKVGAWVPFPVDIVETVLDDEVLIFLIRTALHAWRGMDGVLPRDVVASLCPPGTDAFTRALQRGQIRPAPGLDGHFVLPWWLEMVGSRDEIERRRAAARERKVRSRRVAAAGLPGAPRVATLFDAVDTERGDADG